MGVDWVHLYWQFICHGCLIICNVLIMFILERPVFLNISTYIRIKCAIFYTLCNILRSKDRLEVVYFAQFAVRCSLFAVRRSFRPHDPQLLHPEPQCGFIQSQNRCCSSFSPHPPVCLFQYGQYMDALHFFQGTHF